MRRQNIFSNKAVPSRDIAVKFSMMETIRCIYSGGYNGDGDGNIIWMSYTGNFCIYSSGNLQGLG